MPTGWVRVNTPEEIRSPGDLRRIIHECGGHCQRVFKKHGGDKPYYALYDGSDDVIGCVDRRTGGTTERLDEVATSRRRWWTKWRR